MTSGKTDKEHKFWRTQPVAQEHGETSTEQGVIQPQKSREEIRAESYTLPKNFVWVELDVDYETELQEVYTLLLENYVEDKEQMFRFAYPANLLKWALKPPGWKKIWHVGIRVVSSGKLVAFISGVPVNLRANESHLRAIEINFLCVHKKLRSKRLAPVLIKEITRRCHLEGIFQALYTTGVELPGAVSRARYFHRSLQPLKLVEVGFSYLPSGKTVEQYERRLALPNETRIPGIRPMTVVDVLSVQKGLQKYLNRYKLALEFTLEETEYYFVPREDFFYSYVVEDADSKEITHFISFFKIPSQVFNSDTHKEIVAAFAFYYFYPHSPNSSALQNADKLAALYKDAFVLAKKAGFDVFNCLGLMENEEIVEACKFGRGDGLLNFYLYNWRMGNSEPKLSTKDLGVVLM